MKKKKKKMEKTKLIESFKNNGSAFEIYSVDDLYVPGGYVIDFYVIEKKENLEQNYYIAQYGDSSYTHSFSKLKKDLDTVYQEIQKQPKPKTKMMMVPSYRLPLDGKSLENGDGRIEKERIIEILKTIK